MRKSKQLPDARGYFGQFGGRFVPETLMPALDELEAAYRTAERDPSFWAEVDRICPHEVMTTGICAWKLFWSCC
jgi:tryptophan synthase beta chain